MDKDALFIVAYNETDVSSCATMRHNNILNLTLIFLAQPFLCERQQGSCKYHFLHFFRVRPDLEPATCVPPAPKADAQPTELSRRSYGLS